jgi:hypothetical protein
MYACQWADKAAKQPKQGWVYIAKVRPLDPSFMRWSGAAC